MGFQPRKVIDVIGRLWAFNHHFLDRFSSNDEDRLISDPQDSSSDDIPPILDVIP